MQYTLALLVLAAVVKASPVPQAVTAIITPTGSAPPGCMPTFFGSFGIAVVNVTTATAVKRAVSQISDGQVQAPTAMTMAVVSQIGDGQIQAPKVTTIPIITTTTPRVTLAPITQIGDGQPQAPKATVAPTTTTTVKSTAAAVSQITDGQPQAPKPATSTISTASKASVSTVSTMSKASMSTISTVTKASTPAISKASSAAAPSSTTGTRMVACQTNGTLALTLSNGVLKDSHGRTGYIASNFQFQFDEPPQAGAIVTAGFSVCANGSLALGGSNVFYQCLSGNFFNLYDRNWAAQCSPVTINTLELISCST